MAEGCWETGIVSRAFTDRGSAVCAGDGGKGVRWGQSAHHHKLIDAVVEVAEKLAWHGR